jgi:hypothetical protein
MPRGWSDKDERFFRLMLVGTLPREDEEKGFCNAAQIPLSTCLAKGRAAQVLSRARSARALRTALPAPSLLK